VEGQRTENHVQDGKAKPNQKVDREGAAFLFVRSHKVEKIGSADLLDQTKWGVISETYLSGRLVYCRVSNHEVDPPLNDQH
jgi:hypothetical protein